jgi:hypothetical protein
MLPTGKLDRHLGVDCATRDLDYFAFQNIASTEFQFCLLSDDRVDSIILLQKSGNLLQFGNNPIKAQHSLSHSILIVSRKGQMLLDSQLLF